jgi:hypothetical protein
MSIPYAEGNGTKLFVKREAAVLQIINLETELLIDQSTIEDPYLRLLAIAIGQKFLRGSPWLVINKAVAKTCRFPTDSIRRSCDDINAQTAANEA